MFSRFESGDLSEEADEHNESSNESIEFEYNIKKGDELDSYLLFEFDKSKKQIESFQFWKNHSDRFPILSKYARSIFSIPATTTNVEREFSSAGFSLNERRASLKPDKLDEILLVRSVEKQLYKNSDVFFLFLVKLSIPFVLFFGYFVQLQVASKAYYNVFFIYLL